jgi:hypothetical protein
MTTGFNEKDLLKEFMQPRAESYLNVKENKSSFCFAALIFGSLWLLYRKMYFYFFLVLAWGFILGIVIAIIGIDLKYVSWLGLIPNIVFSAIGKKMYLDFAKEKVKTYKKNPKYSEKVFLELGGTNWSVPILWLFIQMAVTVMLSFPFLKYGI